MDKIGGVLLTIAALIVLPLYLLFPSSHFIRPVTLNYDEDTQKFSFTRHISNLFAQEIADTNGNIRRGHVGRWWTTITLIDGQEYECLSGIPQITFYQITPGNTVRYKAGAWADECLNAGPPFYVTTYRQVLLFGFIPLRPSLSESGIEGIREEPTTIIIVPREE